MLGPPNPYGGFQGFSWPGTQGSLVPSLDMIDNAKEVYEKIRRAQNDAGRGEGFEEMADKKFKSD